MSVLRRQNQVPLQHLRQVKEKLASLPDASWTSVQLYVLNRRVVWEEPGTNRQQDVVAGQYVLRIVLKEVLEKTKSDIRGYIRRDDNSIGQIDNRAVVKGTRISVSALKNFQKAGYSVSQIKSEYPSLDERDIEAALAYEENRVAA